MTLPEGFSPLPFVAARGIPQTVSHAVGTHRLRVTIVASATDLPALLQSSATQVVVDTVTEGLSRRDGRPVGVRDRFRAAASTTLSAEVIRPILIVRENEVLLGALPARPHTLLRFGVTESSGLVVDLYVDTLILTVGSFIQPGETGGFIGIGIRPADKGAGPPTSLRRTEPPVALEDLYASLL